jgi:predicted nucleic acid-binding protein
MGDVRRGAGAVTGTVLVDTNVFTARLRERSPLAIQYAKHLFGQRIALAPQTVAEARYGALKATWGPARTEQLARLLGRARIPPDRHRHRRDRRDRRRAWGGATSSRRAVRGGTWQSSHRK